MVVRVRRTPSPPPNAGDSARVSNAERAATLATLALGNEEEEEEEMEEEEEEETTATVKNSSAPSTRSRDTTNYQVRLKSVGQAIAKTVRQFLIDRGVKSGSEQSKSIEQYMRHVYRYLNYCEELNPNEERNSYYISRQMFEDYLRWYEEKIGRSQNDYKHVSVALGHVVRCFLELDEKKISEQKQESGVVGGDEDESEMYFRSSDGLLRADAKTIAARAGKDVQANDGFWHIGNGKSLLSKKKTDVNLAKMKARNDGVDATDFNKRLLQKVAPEKSFNHIKDDEVKKPIVKEFGRVASKLNEKRKEASEMQVAEAKPFLRRTLEEEWQQLSTTPANGDDEMEEED